LVCKGIIFISLIYKQADSFFNLLCNTLLPVLIINYNQPARLNQNHKYLTYYCKLLTGSFPIFPGEKSFYILTVKEKPVLLHFKKLVQRK